MSRCCLVREALGAACWRHSPWLRMSVRDGAATMATNAGGGGGGGGEGTAAPISHDGRAYQLQIYPRLAAHPSTCCNLRSVERPVCLCFFNQKKKKNPNMYWHLSIFSTECRRMRLRHQSFPTLPQLWGWTPAVCTSWQRWKNVAEKNGCWRLRICLCRGSYCGHEKPKSNTHKALAFTFYYR